MERLRFLVAGCTPWNRQMFDNRLASLAGEWVYVETADELLTEVERQVPELAFFLHWRWIVPPSITAAVECVNFHMTDLPFGRGGSPLQHLLSRGADATTLTAIRMTEEVDAGNIYLKRPLSLEGTAEAIYIRSSAVAVDMVREIVEKRPEPVAQSGEVVSFKRRRPVDSAVPADLGSLDRLHDFIRMLDAEGYPSAVLEHGGFIFEFRRSARYHDRIEADVVVRLAK